MPLAGAGEIAATFAGGNPIVAWAALDPTGLRGTRNIQSAAIKTATVQVQTLQSTGDDDASPHLLAMPGGFIMVSIRTDTIQHRGEPVVQHYDCPLTRWRRAVRRP